MDSLNQNAPPSGKTAEAVYRCKICGIESPETSCFAAIATEGPYRLQGTCITCNQPYAELKVWRRVIALILLAAGPSTYLVATRGTEQIGWIGLMIIAILISPTLTILHELGHALTAKAVGLEVTLITLGAGRFVWAGNILSFPVRIHAWPSAGFTYLGGHPARLIRTRLWLTILLGPVTNFGLMSAAIILWVPLAAVFDANVILLWIVYNALIVAGNLWPQRFGQSGRIYSSDGLQLIQIPFKNPAALAESLGLGHVGAIFVSYQDGDYSGAKESCIKQLAHLPDNPWLLNLLSACYIDLGEYESARAAIAPPLESPASFPPQLHAAIQNNLALALWLRDFDSPQLEQSLQRADALAADAYSKYPCVLAHRSTRALFLAAASRSDEALELLKYMNYNRASPADRSHREFARAFAFRRLGCSAEAEQSLAAGLKLAKNRLPYLHTIGLIS